MVIDILGWVARRRVVVLTAAVVIAVVLRVLLQTTENDHAWRLILAVGFLLPMALVLWSAVCARS